MADTKITALAAITTVDPAADVLPIVDISDTSMAASGTTKKITSNQILGAGGTATLASATITGDLTVDASTFKVNSGNNNVGIGFAGNASSGRLQISQPLGSTIDGALRLTDDATTSLVFNNVSSGLSAIWSSGSIAFGVGSGTFTEAMRLNSTGLGVGTSPTAKLDVNGTVIIRDTFSLLMGFGNQQRILAGGGSDNTFLTFSQWTGAAYTERMRIDQSGNVGISVTPSAWGAGYKAIQIASSQSTALMGSGNQTELTTNAYFDTGWKYQGAGTVAASRYSQQSGVHYWFTAAAGAANATITDFATAKMTLDASGNLLVGKTATNYLTVGCEIKPLGAFNCTQSGSTNANTAWDTYSTGASAYRFYVGMGGTVFATNTTISAISDARLKENVQDIDVGLGAILALKPRKFDWKAGKGKDIKGDRGFIAQEFEQVFPQLVDEWADPAPEGEAPYKSVRQDLIPVLVKAIQELTARVQTLEAR